MRRLETIEQDLAPGVGVAGVGSQGDTLEGGHPYRLAVVGDACCQRPAHGLQSLLVDLEFIRY